MGAPTFSRLRIPSPAPAVAMLAAAAVLVVGLVAGAHVAGGADSSGYLSQERLWAEGRLELVEPAARRATWPNAAWTFAPLGYRPGAAPDTLVPLYPPGYPLAMAAVHRATGAAWTVFLVVPALGALAVWLTFALGRHVAGAGAGAWAAVLLACNPVFLFQLVQPMSDVPATAWWLAAVVLVMRGGSAAFAAGLCTSAALLTRPNTAPLAIIPVIALAMRWTSRPTSGEPGSRSALGRLPAVLGFVTGLAPGAAALAWINSSLYGGPFRSGYGDLGLFFSPSHVPVNAARYASWLVETRGAIVALGALAAVALAARHRAGERRTRQASFWALAFGGGLLATYLLYTPFGDWTYLRYLLPAFPLLIVLGTAALLAAGRRLGPRWRSVAPLLLAIAAVDSLVVARAHGVAAVRHGERRYPVVAQHVARQAGSGTIVIGLQHTGSLRYYEGMTTVRYDLLERDWLDRCVARVREMGRGPVFLLEEWEEQVFRERFAGQEWGALDWPPRVQFDARGTVRLYDPADRDAHRLGLRPATTHIRVADRPLRHQPF